MSFSFEQEVNGKLALLDVEVSPQQGKFVTTVFNKPTFIGVYTHFDSFFANGLQNWYDMHSNLPMF